MGFSTSNLRIIFSIPLLFFAIIGSADERITLAVAPLRNVMQNRDLDWMSEGFAETITTKLNHVSSLKLVERIQISEVLKELQLGLTDLTEQHASNIGKLVNADYLVLGSYQRIGSGGTGTLKINTRVVDVATGVLEHGKAATASGPYEQVFEIQEKIATSLARGLGGTLADEELRLLSIDETTSVAAYELYNIARYEIDERRKEQLLLRALELDPHYAKAHLLLGSFYVTRAHFDRSFESRALEHVRLALAINQQLEDAHYVLGEYCHHRVREGDLKRDGEEAFRRDGIAHLTRFIESKKSSEATYYVRKVERAQRMLRRLES
jgi:TolB-like protein